VSALRHADRNRYCYYSTLQPNTHCDITAALLNADSTNSYSDTIRPRRHSDFYSNANSSCRPDRYSSAEANTGSAPGVTFAHANCYGHPVSYPYAERYACSDAAASAYATTATITIYEKDTHCSFGIV
jgi:hypothetical protein